MGQDLLKVRSQQALSGVSGSLQYIRRLEKSLM